MMSRTAASRAWMNAIRAACLWLGVFRKAHDRTMNGETASLDITLSWSRHRVHGRLNRVMSRSTIFASGMLVAASVSAGCASHQVTTADDVASALRTRTATAARVTGVAGADLPAGVGLDDGLTPDEAVSIALWNSPAFQTSVSQLGFARADLVDAGMLSNPVFALLFPWGPKQFEGTVRWSAEVLWERPRRMAAARLGANAAAERLVQTGLDLVAATRIAHADLAFQIDREKIMRDAATLLARIDTLTQSRLAAGDIGELEARAASVDAARARQDAERAVHDITIARERLRQVIGLPGDTALNVAPSAAPLATCGAPADLLREALAARPDIRAAELTVEAATARLGWERSRVLTLTAVLDSNGQGRAGFEAGPGLDFSLPIFNRNQGGRARGHAELQRAAAAYVAVQQQVALELRESSAQFEQARQSAEAWRTTITGPLETNLTAAERSFAQGDTSYLFVLENSRRLIDARLRARELDADQQRAHARVERALGRSCGQPSQETPRAR